MGKCSVESCTKETYRNAKHCPRHAVQLRKYGMIVSDKPSYKDLNEIRIYENYAEIVLRSKMGDEIAVSRIDLDVVVLINDKKWYLTDHGYCASRGKKGSWYLHRLVLGCDGQIDHINGNRLDNRADNLRPCSQSQNNANTFARKTSKTGIKGVFPYKGGPKFASQITHNGKTFCLGVFLTIQEAKNAYDEKSKELFGEFARIAA